MSASHAPDPGAVAIVAVAGRFPGAADVDAFWRNLCAGVESIRRYDAAELDGLGVARELRANPRFVPAGALVDGIERFDAALFGFTPREAELLDPQHRVFFECVWEALERAGYAPGLIREPVGLFAGTSLSTYLIYNLIPQGEAVRTAGVYQTYIANDKDSLTTHVAYKLNLRGPGVTIQTACSTSLVAAHFACQSLIAFQCDLAIAGGVSLQVPHQPGYLYQDGAIASPDGRCRAFDADAAGTVPGNGAGVVVLKRLADAIDACDQIIAVIRGGAVNNDGAAKVGYTAPGADGQAEVIALAQAVAGVDAATIGYVEAHGTGTPLGDPIEIAALRRAFRGSPRGGCAIGSVKTNIGHLDAASGVAGLIKAALAVQHGVIPPTLHFRTPNPRTELADSPFFVAASQSAWPSANRPRRAGVSSFGIGGTNAHIVLEEAPEPEPAAPSRPVQILTMSARSPASLDALAGALALRFGARDAPPLADAAFTLHVGRRTWPERAAVVCRTAEDAARALGSPIRASVPAGERTVVFLFPGQGAQFPGMAGEAYAAEPAFREELDACCSVLLPLVGVDLRDLVVHGDAASTDDVERLNQTAIAQPALFAVEYAMAALWRSWGVKPAATLGHSVGEYVSACLAGVFGRDAALTLVAARGRLMQAAPRGAMLAIAASESIAAPLLPSTLSIAAINGPQAVVASGPFDEIDKLAALLSERRIAHRRLETSHAFHSSMMDAAAAAFRSEVEAASPRRPSGRFISNVSGAWISESEAISPDYWAQHLRAPVRFGDGLGRLAASHVLLEVGPGRALTSLARQHVAGGSPAAVRSMRTRDEQVAGDDVLADAIARLWVNGVSIDWARYHHGERRRRVLLPTTPFERQRYWIDAPARGGEPAALPIAPQPEAALRSAGTDVASWLYVPTWSDSACADSTPGLNRRIAIVGGDDSSLAALAASRFSAAGHATEVVTAAREALASRLAAAPAPDLVVYLGLLCGRADGKSADDLRRAAFDVPVWIAQAASTQRSDVEIVIVVNRLFDEAGSFAPERALAGGPLLVAPQELPHVRCRLVEVETGTPAAHTDWLDQLAVEIAARRPEHLVGYRGGRRRARTVTPHPQGPRASRFETGGAYWITGAAGAMGHALADHLARTYRARLLLTSRSPLPADFVAMLATAGAETIVHAADVADAAAMQAACREARARFGRLDGIIHAAGVPGGGLLARTPAATMHATLAPKLAGTLVVAELARAEGVRFLALCSSLAAVRGGFGQTDYVAANAFLDAFAAWHTRESNVFTVSIGWDGWREAGMAVAVNARLRAAAGGPPEARALDYGMTMRQGIEVFERVLAGDAPHVIVSMAPLVDTVPAPPRHASRVSTPLSIDARVADLWQRVLGVETSAAGGNFFDAGGDSLKGVQLVAVVNEAFGIDLPVARFFGAPTIGGLAALVRESTGAAGEDDAVGPGDDPALAVSRARGLRRSRRRREVVS